MSEPRIHPLSENEASPDALTILKLTGCHLEAKSNLFRTVAHTPAALACLAAQLDAAARMQLSARAREAIALRVADLNGCAYFPAAHPATSEQVGVDAACARRFRQGLSDDPKEQALLALTTKVVLERGQHCGFAIATAREVGVTDAMIVEAIALIGLNSFCNYVSLVANTAPDHPAPGDSVPEESEKTS